MNAFDKAVDDLRFKIPPRILDQFFIKRNQNYRSVPKSTKERIFEEVIRPRVLVDMNLVGGTEFMVDLSGLSYDQLDMYTRVYRIPKSLTNNRSIMSVKSVSYGNPGISASYGNNAGYGGNTFLQAGEAMMGSHAMIPNVSTARCELVGEGVVLIKDTTALPMMMFMRVVLEYDEEMTDWQKRSYPALGKLVEFAVKSYIHNIAIVEMDLGELYAGQTLGTIKTVIEGWSESEQNYQDHLRTVMGRVAMMNDGQRMTRHIRQLIGGYK